MAPVNGGRLGRTEEMMWSDERALPTASFQRERNACREYRRHLCHLRHHHLHHHLRQHTARRDSVAIRRRIADGMSDPDPVQPPDQNLQKIHDWATWRAT
eukprot:g28025.t1